MFDDMVSAVIFLLVAGTVFSVLASIIGRLGRGATRKARVRGPKAGDVWQPRPKGVQDDSARYEYDLLELGGATFPHEALEAIAQVAENGWEVVGGPLVFHEGGWGIFGSGLRVNGVLMAKAPGVLMRRVKLAPPPKPPAAAKPAPKPVPKPVPPEIPKDWHRA
jgi:hypothetical protein